MHRIFGLTREDIEDICNETSMSLGMSGAAIEKDLWVCFILSVIFSDSKLKDMFRFKGGTSLSKAYGLIRRFSEDIDLILDWRVLGFSADEPWQKRSNSAQAKFNKDANERAVRYVENEILPSLPLRAPPVRKKERRQFADL